MESKVKENGHSITNINVAATEEANSEQPSDNNHNHNNSNSNNKNNDKNQNQSDTNQSNNKQHKERQLSVAQKLIIDCVLSVIKSLVSVYDIVTLPIYCYRDRVWQLRDDVEKVRVKRDEVTGSWSQVDLEPVHDYVKQRIDSFATYDRMMDASFEQFAHEPCYGYRDVQRVVHIKRRDGSGKVLRQVELSDYHWVDFAEFGRQIEYAKRGFQLEGIKAGHVVMLFADTRPEWQIAAQALIRLGATVGTMYATLGTDGICHSINETKVTHCVTQREFVERLEKLGDRLPKLEKIVYFEPSIASIRALSAENSSTEKIVDNQDSSNKQHQQQQNASASNEIAINGKYHSGDETERLLNTTSTNTTGETVLANGNSKINGHVHTLSNNSHTETTNATITNSEVKMNGEIKTVLANGKPLSNGFVAKPINNNNVSSTDNLTSTRYQLVSFSDLMARGKVQPVLAPAPRPASRDQVAVIMYTSGSTGKPKGVMLTHGNIMGVIEAFSYVTKEFVHDSKNNTVAAYLPLAHIFEFSIQSMMLFHGVKFGFASPHTLTDKSPGLRPGQKGDLTLLRPTCLIIVPLILDRIVQGVKQALRDQGYFKNRLVSWLIEYKSYWQQRYYETPIVNRLVCSKISAALGGRARYVICGSAPLAPETQQFVRAAFDIKLPQGFGTTETGAATSCQLFDDYSTGNVGLPVCNARIKLEPWEEGNYHPSDKPHPRGEICVGGPMIAAGYYNMDELTKETFYTDEHGIRWYRTGDIGAILPNGNLKIIDRKKDLVKLQNGEYVSLGKIESTLKSNLYLDNFCAYADSRHNHIVACGPVNEPAVSALAQQLLQENNNNTTAQLDQNDHQQREKSQQENDQSLNQQNKSEALVELEQLVEERKKLAAYALRRDSQLSVNSVKGGAGGEISTEPSWLARVCANPLVAQAIYASLVEQANDAQLMRLEIPRAFLALPDEWTAETGLVTAALKIRRAFIYKRYERELTALYNSSNGSSSINTTSTEQTPSHKKTTSS